MTQPETVATLLAELAGASAEDVLASSASISGTVSGCVMESLLVSCPACQCKSLT